MYETSPDLGDWLDARLDEAEDVEQMDHDWRWSRTRQHQLRRESHLRTRYGLTVAEYDTMLEAQEGRCAICGDAMTMPFVDHDHDTGEVRGLLCVGCNSGLGLLGDNAAGLERALAYLRGD